MLSNLDNVMTAHPICQAGLPTLDVCVRNDHWDNDFARTRVDMNGCPLPYDYVAPLQIILPTDTHVFVDDKCMGVFDAGQVYEYPISYKEGEYHNIRFVFDGCAPTTIHMFAPQMFSFKFSNCEGLEKLSFAPLPNRPLMMHEYYLGTYVAAIARQADKDPTVCFASLPSTVKDMSGAFLYPKFLPSDAQNNYGLHARYWNLPNIENLSGVFRGMVGGEVDLSSWCLPKYTRDLIADITLGTSSIIITAQPKWGEPCNG